MKKFKCPICDSSILEIEKEKHIIQHIDDCQSEEAEWLRLGKEAKQLYRLLFNKDA